jgi:hypothetical protein
MVRIAIENLRTEEKHGDGSHFFSCRICQKK